MFRRSIGALFSAATGSRVDKAVGHRPFGMKVHSVQRQFSHSMLPSGPSEIIGSLFQCQSAGKSTSQAIPSLNVGRTSLIFRCFASSTIQSESSLNATTADGASQQHKKESDSTDSAGKPIRGGPVSWMSFFLLALTGAGLVYYYDREKKRHIEEVKTAATAVREGPSVGKAAIGGPFNLVNHEGKVVTEKDFMGKWTVIYFGFTHCPDICPEELQKLVLAIDEIKQRAGIEVVPVFISVDPERDTVEQVGEYIAEFHPALIGLTGSVEEVKQAARAYRVYYMKTEEEGSDYLVDHSIVMYLMDPQMEFVKFFGKNNDVGTLTEGIIKEIKQYKKRA